VANVLEHEREPDTEEAVTVEYQGEQRVLNLKQRPTRAPVARQSGPWIAPD